MITEAVILAGGLGTRLRSAVPDLPKCMAPVAGRPFISYVIDALRRQGIQQFIFSLGYKAEVIEAYLAAQYPTVPYSIVREEAPLGTGGAIQFALQKATTENVLIANGDTLFEIDLWAFEKVHTTHNAECTLALKPMRNFDRYGVVQLDGDGQVQSFKEKQFYTEGLINGGVYILNKSGFLSHGFPQKFSFETVYLEKHGDSKKLWGSIQTGYFVDIGIPEDFEKAGLDLHPETLDLSKVDTSWTLFLDRDGVINNERVGQYVLNWDEFYFSDGVLDAFPILNQKFGHLFIVTNQRGVSKGLMTEEDLKRIHNQMVTHIEATGATIEAIYYCTDKENSCFNRKPNPGMALQAFKDYPHINPAKCIMVGNKPSDMRFGRAAGMYTVFLTTTNPDEPFPHPDVDLQFPSLLTFAQALQS